MNRGSIQEVSVVYTSAFLDTDELKMALRARKVSGAFKKRAPSHSSINVLSKVMGCRCFENIK